MGDLGQQEPSLDAAAFELTRFEWDGDGLIELEGAWSGVRGTRFVRPTLVVAGGGETRRLLATLEHKPWEPRDGEPWRAAFAWEGGPIEVESAELGVAPGIDVELPAPSKAGAEPAGGARMKRAPGKRLPATPDDDDDALAAALVRAARLERERDEAVAARRALAREVEELRQAREHAVSEARAKEREVAAGALAEGAELRARVEAQRAEAIALRDAAFAERDEARAAQVHAEESRRAAEAGRKEAQRAQKRAERDRDKALAEAARARGRRDQALAERERANAERDLARKERDALLSAHERGLPLREPQPRFRPEPAPRDPVDAWIARAVAGGIVAILLLVVALLFLA